MSKSVHWTEKSTKKFLFAIALDFVDQLEARMKELGYSRAKLAKKAKVDKSYVSQVLNNPGNLSLETIVKFARVLKMKVSVVAYDDGDMSNERGPINAEIFRLCWEHNKKPDDMWSFRQHTQSAPVENWCFYQEPIGRHGNKPKKGVTVRNPNREVEHVYKTHELGVDVLITSGKAPLSGFVFDPYQQL